MKHIHLLLLALLALFAGSPFRAAAEESFRDRVVVIPVGEDSLTSKQSFGFMNRILKRAQEEQARAVVFDLNTPGGLAWETSEMMIYEKQLLSLSKLHYTQRVPDAQLFHLYYMQFALNIFFHRGFQSIEKAPEGGFLSAQAGLSNRCWISWRSMQQTSPSWTTPGPKSDGMSLFFHRWMTRS